MITINKTRQKNNNYQFVYITLTVDGDACKTIISAPVVPDLQSYLDAHETEYIINVLGGMYPDAKWQETEGKTDLEKFENWITKGCINSEQDEMNEIIPQQIIKKVPWKNMHLEKTEMEKLIERIEVLEAKQADIEKVIGVE